MQLLEMDEMKAALQGKRGSNFLSVLNHDLLQPIAAAKLIVGSIGFGISDLDKSEHNRKLLEAALGQVTEFVDKIVIFETLKQREYTIEFQSVDVLQLVHECVRAVLNRNLNWSGSVEVVGETQVLIADRSLLTRLFGELLSNAIRHADADLVEIAIQNESGAVIVSVKDQGRGMSETEMREAFKPFKRLPKSEVVEFEGPGLGLSSCVLIAEQIGIQMSMTSMPGKGTRVDTVLPIAKQAETTE